MIIMWNYNLIECSSQQDFYGLAASLGVQVTLLRGSAKKAEQYRIHATSPNGGMAIKKLAFAKFNWGMIS